MKRIRSIKRHPAGATAALAWMGLLAVSIAGWGPAWIGDLCGLLVIVVATLYLIAGVMGRPAAIGLAYLAAGLLVGVAVWMAAWRLFGGVIGIVMGVPTIPVALAGAHTLRSAIERRHLGHETQPMGVVDPARLMRVEAARRLYPAAFPAIDEITGLSNPNNSSV